MSKKIIDLEKHTDGTYSPKHVNHNVRNSKGKGLIHLRSGEKPKYIMHDDASEFLGGIDAGLDLIDSVVPRIERFLRLRG